MALCTLIAYYLVFALFLYMPAFLSLLYVLELNPPLPTTCQLSFVPDFLYELKQWLPNFMTTTYSQKYIYVVTQYIYMHIHQHKSEMIVLGNILFITRCPV